MGQAPDIAPRYVSVVNEFPEDLYEAMRGFVRSHPSWDQYRLMQVALAGFLFQQGSRDRAVARHYLDGLFDRGSTSVAAAEPQRPAAAVSPAESSSLLPRRRSSPPPSVHHPAATTRLQHGPQPAES